jgi:hypothetical protein
MPKFIGIKIHYDIRPELSRETKYSKLPTLDEYQHYVRLYEDEGKGGHGFHECLNFSVASDSSVRFYLPPTCFPAAGDNDDFVVFSFTYKTDEELPNYLIGVHAGCEIVADKDGICRPRSERIRGIDPLVYHAKAPSDLVTLFSTPLNYNVEAGRYSPKFEKWGYGLRYIQQEHVENILHDAIANAEHVVRRETGARGDLVRREIDVLRNIIERYRVDIKRPLPSNGRTKAEMHEPDKALGDLGERMVVEREIAYVKRHGLPESVVIWYSRIEPFGRYDIETVRIGNDGQRAHFIEVKSSRLEDGMNVYLSSGQIDHLKQRAANSSVALVSFSNGDKQHSIRELTLDELISEFHLDPIKFKLRRKE